MTNSDIFSIKFGKLMSSFQFLIFSTAFLKNFQMNKVKITVMQIIIIVLLSCTDYKFPNFTHFSNDLFLKSNEFVIIIDVIILK